MSWVRKAAVGAASGWLASWVAEMFQARVEPSVDPTKEAAKSRMFWGTLSGAAYALLGARFPLVRKGFGTAYGGAGFILGDRSNLHFASRLIYGAVLELTRDKLNAVLDTLWLTQHEEEAEAAIRRSTSRAQAPPLGAH